MSDAQRPQPQADEPAASAAPQAPQADDRASTDVDGNPIPSNETLASQALPAVYSRSPRLIRVIGTAAAAGALLGAIIGAVLPSAFLSGRGSAAAVMAFAGAIAGALIAGAIVANAEYREARHVAQRKDAAIDEWLAAHPDQFIASDKTHLQQGSGRDGSSST